MSVDISLDGISEVMRFFERAPDLARKSAVLAVNYGAKRARQTGAKQMRKEIAFTAGYLSDESRLSVAKKATLDNPEAIVRGRDRPTSLARFRVGTPVFGSPKKGKNRAPIRVRVQTGSTVTVQDAAFVKLRNNNIGIISKGRPGARKAGENEKYRWFRKTKKGEKVPTDYYLRYGPSVEQVFSGVRNVIAPGVLSDTEREFFRQFRRLSK